MAQDCIFCKISNGEIDSEILYRDDHCFVIRDIAPKAPVHLLVIPNEHFTYLTNLSPEFYPTIGSMFAAAEEMAKREDIHSSGYRLVVNQRAEAGQQVPHRPSHILECKRLAAMA